MTENNETLPRERQEIEQKYLKLAKELELAFFQRRGD